MHYDLCSKMSARRVILSNSVSVFLALLCIIDLASAADGNWSEWLEWSPCSVTCGGGEMRRMRFCNNPTPSRGGRTCAGRPIQTEECEAPAECPVDGQWSSWGLWAACSVTCGEGVQTRRRRCDSPPPANGGRNCEGGAHESMTCVVSKNCPRDGKWSQWGEWSACSVTCGDGTSYRYRQCNNPPPSPNGRDCQGDNQHSRVCRSLKKCSVNGHWSEWSEWSDCSVTCGSGVRQRWRKCDNPPPQNGGDDCRRNEAGEMQESSCNGTVVFCPVDGGWSDWGEWGECVSPSCGSEEGLAYTVRQRSCNNPYPSHKGSMCQGTFLDAGMCDIPINCPVDGGWSDWTKWECSQENLSRHRKCDNPPPFNGGKNCQGPKAEIYGRDDVEFEQYCPHMLKEESQDGRIDADNKEEEKEEEEEYDYEYYPD